MAIKPINLNNGKSINWIIKTSISDSDDDNKNIHYGHISKVIPTFGLSTTELKISWVEVRFHKLGPKPFIGFAVRGDKEANFPYIISMNPEYQQCGRITHNNKLQFNYPRDQHAVIFCKTN